MEELNNLISNIFFQSQFWETVFQKSFFDWKTFFCCSDSSVNKKFIEGLGLLVASSAHVALRAGEQLFIFDYFFFLEKFKFKLFSAHNNCNCVVRVQNIFF